jgi:hypothetical protein
MLLALWAALAGISMNAALAQDWQAALHQFSHQDDLPQQRAALLTLLDATGASSKLHATQQAQVVGSPGLFAWATPNTSYCTWWGVNCCSATLTASLQLCLQGTNSVSGLHVVAVNLTGQLPDVFEDLPDLQLLAIAYNRGGPKLARMCAGMRARRLEGELSATAACRQRAESTRALRGPAPKACAHACACGRRPRRTGRAAAPEHRKVAKPVVYRCHWDQPDMQRRGPI